MSLCTKKITSGKLVLTVMVDPQMKIFFTPKVMAPLTVIHISWKEDNDSDQTLTSRKRLLIGSTNIFLGIAPELLKLRLSS